MLALALLALVGAAHARPQFNQLAQQPLRTQQPSVQQHFAVPQQQVRTQQTIQQQPLAQQQFALPQTQQFAPSPQQQFAPAPQQHFTPASHQQFSPTPLQQFAPAPQRQFAQQQTRSPPITVLQRTELSDENGHFETSVSQSDGSSFQEIGNLEPTNDNLDKVVVKKGSFSYTSPEGVPVKIDYTADRYGFHPVGSVIPVAGH